MTVPRSVERGRDSPAVHATRQPLPPATAQAVADALRGAVTKGLQVFSPRLFGFRRSVASSR